MAGPGSWSRGSEGGEGQGVMRWKAGVKGGRYGTWDMLGMWVSQELQWEANGGSDVRPDFPLQKIPWLLRGKGTRGLGRWRSVSK